MYKKAALIVNAGNTNPTKGTRKDGSRDGDIRQKCKTAIEIIVFFLKSKNTKSK